MPFYPKSQRQFADKTDSGADLDGEVNLNGEADSDSKASLDGGANSNSEASLDSGANSNNGASAESVGAFLSEEPKAIR